MNDDKSITFNHFVFDDDFNREVQLNYIHILSSVIMFRTDVLLILMQ